MDQLCGDARNALPVFADETRRRLGEALDLQLPDRACRYTDASGRARQGSARTLAEARRLKAQRATDAARGERHETSRLTLAVYANEWLSSYQGRTSRGIRVETLADYRHELGLYALPLLGGLRLGEIEPRHVKELAALVSDGGRRKPRTVKLAIAPLRALLATAVDT